jgi:hypothetical protein
MNAILLANMQPVMQNAEFERIKKQQALNAMQPIEGSLDYEYLKIIFKNGAAASKNMREGKPNVHATLPAVVLKKYVEAGYLTYESKGGVIGGIYRPAKGVTAQTLNIDLTEH